MVCLLRQKIIGKILSCKNSEEWFLPVKVICLTLKTTGSESTEDNVKRKYSSAISGS